MNAGKRGLTHPVIAKSECSAPACDVETLTFVPDIRYLETTMHIYMYVCICTCIQKLYTGWGLPTHLITSCMYIRNSIHDNIHVQLEIQRRTYIYMYMTYKRPENINTCTLHVHERDSSCTLCTSKCTCVHAYVHVSGWVTIALVYCNTHIKQLELYIFNHIHDVKTH